MLLLATMTVMTLIVIVATATTAKVTLAMSMMEKTILRLCYVKVRSTFCRFDPLWNSVVVGGVEDDGRKVLGHVNMIGVMYADSHVATGEDTWNQRRAFLSPCVRWVGSAA